MLNNVYSLGCPSKIIGNGVVYILNILKIKNAHNSIYNTCIAYAIQYTSKLGLTQCPVMDKCSEFSLTCILTVKPVHAYCNLNIIILSTHAKSC